MKELPFPATRLATVLAVSGCIHLLGLALLMRAHHAELRTGATAPIAVRLARAPASPAVRAPAPSSRATPAPASATPAPRRPAPRRAVSQAPKQQDLPAAPAPPVPAAAMPDRQAAVTADGYLSYPPDLPPPPRYTMSWPAANSLRFDSRKDDAAGAVVPDEVRFSVAYGAEGYAVSIGATAASDAGPAMRSEGARLDDGFAPLRATTSRNGLPESHWRLNRFHDPAAADAPASDARQVIVHDPASMLLQLMGMALHDATQLESPVQLAVAGAAGVGLVTFELAAVHTITVPYGTFEAWHLVQTAGPDAGRMEVWLAPSLGWYPLQLKITAPNGAVVTQRLLRAEQPLQPAP